MLPFVYASNINTAYICEILAGKTLDWKTRENELLRESVGIVEYNCTQTIVHVTKDGFPFQRNRKSTYRYNIIYNFYIEFSNLQIM